MSDARLVYDMPEAEYHSRPELSSTGARAILSSPARFRYDQEHRVEKTAYDVGHAVHARVLGVGSPVIEYPPEHLTPSGAASKKAATEVWLSEQRAAGLVPVTPDQFIEIDDMAEAVLTHREARRLLEQPGHPEVSAFAIDPETGVRVRARFDLLPDLDGDDRVAVDLKTTRGLASRAGFAAEAARYGYPVQEAWYLDALRWATGAEPDFRFIVVEKARPHLVAVHEFPDVVRIAARELAAQARSTYVECVTSGDWPGYGEGVITTDMPAWWWHQVDDDTDDMEVI